MPTCQLLLHQPLAIALPSELANPISMMSGSTLPRIAFRPMHDDEAKRMSEGGTRIAVEYETDDEDLLRATYLGIRLVNEFLAAIALATGIPFLPNQALQLLQQRSSCLALLYFLPYQGLSWPRPLAMEDVRNAQSILKHWCDDDEGRRLREAGQRYLHALASDSSSVSFYHAYAGLEALETPLAQECDIPPGVEIVEGKCERCGASYERKRTALAGVRAFVKGEHHDAVTPDRENDWKKLRVLRTDMAHALKGSDEMVRRSEDLLPVVCHYLHDASVHLAHFHELESRKYELGRPTGQRLLLRGFVEPAEFPDLSSQELLLECHAYEWVQHESGLVPQYEINKHSSAEIKTESYVLRRDLSSASEDDLILWETEAASDQS